MKHSPTEEIKIHNLIREIKLLRFELNILKSAIYPNDLSWASPPLALAEKHGVRLSPYGDSLDFCRTIELLSKLNLLT
ncbi:hypothetical protein ACT2VT_000182 [Pantoea agglomerans]